MRFPLACGYHALFHDSTLLFSRSSGQLGINIHVLEDSLRRELLTNSEYRRQSVVYLVGLEITQSQLDIFNNQGFLQTIAGEFGEVQFDVLGIDIVPNSGQSQPSIWLRLRATKIGMAENWELFLEKMRKLQSNFGLARIHWLAIGHNFEPELAETALHLVFKPWHVEGEWFNLSPERRTLAVERMINAHQTYAQQVNGVGGLLFVCGRANYPTDYLTPLNGPDIGWVYAAWPNFDHADVQAMLAIVNEGANGVHGFHQDQVDFVTKTIQVTKIGSTNDPNDRVRHYLWASCLTDSFHIGASQSRSLRPDERRRQASILSIPVGAPGSRPILPPNSPHVSGEWMRCTGPQRQNVVTDTQNELHNHALPANQGIIHREAFHVTAGADDRNAMLHWGLVTNDELERNNRLP
mmetsp:Transcript_102/g.232  ORF Transcript_102/g.232 Transcript_102/m.232 type:complete len:409 (+) Transcript_102:88-1314(+)